MYTHLTSSHHACDSIATSLVALQTFSILTWQIASCLSHHPDWYTFDRLTASCSQDQVVPQLRKLWQGHDDDGRLPSTRPQGRKGIPQECNLPANLAGKNCRAMEFSQKRRRVESAEYPTRLQLYKTPPVDTISLQEFEELALQRLKRECCPPPHSHR